MTDHVTECKSGLKFLLVSINLLRSKFLITKRNFPMLLKSQNSSSTTNSLLLEYYLNLIWLLVIKYPTVTINKFA